MLLQQARKVGYVFSGGSARCAFQVGVIETLREIGVRPALTTRRVRGRLERGHRLGPRRRARARLLALVAAPPARPAAEPPRERSLSLALPGDARADVPPLHRIAPFV